VNEQVTPAGERLLGRSQGAAPLLRVEVDALAGGAEEEHAVGAALEQEVDHRPEDRLVHALATIGQRGQHRGI
jgi:hypothetical protein